MKLSILMIVGSIFFINGCGNGDTNSLKKSSEDIGTNIRMKKNIPYTINRGDEIENINNPVIELSSDLKSGKSIAILKSGEASIIKK